LKDAINGMFEKGYISQEDKDLVRDLSFKGDKHLQSAWDAYLVMTDEEEFVDSIQVLCDVKRKVNAPASQNSQEEFGRINLMGMNQPPQ